MCINKENWTCCCGCSLTTATWIIGILELLGAIGSGFEKNWLGFVTSIAILSLIILTIIDRHKPSYRKFLYYIYLILTIFCTILFAVAIFVVAFSDYVEQYFEELCAEN